MKQCFGNVAVGTNDILVKREGSRGGEVASRFPSEHMT